MAVLILNVSRCKNCKAHDPETALDDLPYWWWCSVVENIINATMGCDEYWKHRKTLKERLFH